MLHMAAKANRTELWRERVLAQQASGQTVRGWCRANNCPEHGFYWWRANLGLSPASARKRRRVRKAASIGFARVVVEPLAPVVAEPLRLMLVGGRELTLPASMPVEQVARLLRAIETAGAHDDQGAA
jgi:hypothetical protein